MTSHSDPPISSVPPPARFDHGGGDCPIHGDNVPFRKRHKASERMKCVACESAGEWIAAEGYPTEAALDKIRAWGFRSDHVIEDSLALMEFVRTLWWHPTLFTIGHNSWVVHTGGWSGNESLIEALQDNAVFWSFCWFASQRGGTHRFLFPGETDGANG